MQYLVVSAVQLSCLQSSGAIQSLGGPRNTPQWHHNIVPGRLLAYWKTHRPNFLLPEIGAVWILLRKMLEQEEESNHSAKCDVILSANKVSASCEEEPAEMHTVGPTFQWSTKSQKQGWIITNFCFSSYPTQSLFLLFMCVTNQ